MMILGASIIRVEVVAHLIVCPRANQTLSHIRSFCFCFCLICFVPLSFETPELDTKLGHSPDLGWLMQTLWSVLPGVHCRHPDLHPK